MGKECSKSATWAISRNFLRSLILYYFQVNTTVDDKLQTFTQSNLLITKDKNLNASYLHVTQVNQLQLQAWLLLSDTHYINKFTEIYQFSHRFVGSFHCSVAALPLIHFPSQNKNSLLLFDTYNVGKKRKDDWMPWKTVADCNPDYKKTPTSLMSTWSLQSYSAVDQDIR